MAVCPTPSAEGAFLSALLRHIDCQGQTIGAAGYQALAEPGSPLSLVLTSLLTIFIALFGFRMILGETPSMREGVLAVVKIGVVLLIATSWPAYRTVIYDVIVQGPSQLSVAIGGPAGLPGTNGDLIGRLQVSDDAITRLTTLGSGRDDLQSRPSRDASGAPRELERAPLADDLAFGSARVLLLSSVIAAFAVVKLGAGVLLALAPLFAGLLLFGFARGLFVGWMRALAFTMLSSIAVTLILGVELALLEPWLSQTLQLRHARVITPEAPIELLVLCLAFAIALAGTIAVILRLAFALHLPFGARASVRAQDLADRFELPRSSREQPTGPVRSDRALAIANAVSAVQRREAYRPAAFAVHSLTKASSAGAARAAAASAGAAPASSQALRRTRPRKSAAAALRDRRS